MNNYKETNKYREMMFSGNLYMPKIAKIKQVFGHTVYEEVERMFEAMWYAYLKQGTKGTISLPYWAQRIKNVKAMNVALKLLSTAGWIETNVQPINNWGEAQLCEKKLLQFMDKTELASIRKSIKFSKYVLNNEAEATKNNLVRINGRTRSTGLVREGFRKTSNVQFQFDIEKMVEYKYEIVALINKGIDKMMIRFPQIKNDLAHYGNVGEEIIEHYIWDEGKYTAGQNKIDSRGRNISGMLNKIGNPIGFKIMRSLLVLPEAVRNTATPAGLRNKYLFIAELLGYKNGNVAGKVNFGRRAYLNKKLLDLDLPEDMDDLFENIWLERMYEEIDYVLNIAKDWKKKTAMARFNKGQLSMTATAKKIETFIGNKWYVPTEIDASASVLMIEGLLLSHKPFLNRTNVIGGTIQDAWGHSVITNRLQFKTIMRVCYGSSASPAKMWSDMEIKYTLSEVQAFELELETGEIAVANKFKDFMIQNANMTEKMNVVIDNNEFEIECNRYYSEGDRTDKFDLYDSKSHSIRRIHNTTTVKTADLKRFRVFTPTCLVHGLDSQVEDNTVGYVVDVYGWALDIHDAIVLCCEATDYAKDIYCSGKTEEEPSLERIHRERNNILGKYFTSIGIRPSKLEDWKREVKPHVEKYEGKLRANRIALK